MKKLVQVTEVEGEGLLNLLGKRVLLMCSNWFYCGTLTGVNTQCVELTDPEIVYETGDWAEAKTKWKFSQKLPAKTCFVGVSFIESYMEL